MDKFINETRFIIYYMQMSETLVLYIDFESFTYILIFEFFTLIF